MAIAKSCLRVEKHLRFVSLDRNVRYLEKSLQSFVEAYASKLGTQVSNLTGSKELMEGARIYLEAIKTEG